MIKQLENQLKSVRDATKREQPLIHCITNPISIHGCAFGPPLPFTATSTWTWVDHPVSGLPGLTLRAVNTCFHFGSVP